MKLCSHFKPKKKRKKAAAINPAGRARAVDIDIKLCRASKFPGIFC